MLSRRCIVRAPFKALFALAVLAAGWAVPHGGASGQEIRFFRIGTGSISGVYFPVGGLIANAVSNPPGSRACDAGGSCGVPGLIAVAQATLGSIANARAIGAGSLESALVQADVAQAAFKGTGEFNGGAIADLRAIASLYPEALHVVVRRNSQIKSVRDLVGRRVSLDLVGSGTRQVALEVLRGVGVDPATLKQVNSQIGPAADRIRLGRIEAFFFVGGAPVSALARLARDVPIRLIGLDKTAIARIRAKNPFLKAAVIPAGTYRGSEATTTLGVHALWLVSAKAEEKIVYGLARALWHPSTRRLLDHGVPVAQQIDISHALVGVTVPLHPGAERYYRENDVLRMNRPNDN